MPETTIYPDHGSYLMPSIEHATVADAMHPGILSCDPDASATEVARIMATHHVHCVAVMHAAYDRSGEPYLWGIISDIDLMRSGFDFPAEKKAGAMAKQPTISVKPEMALSDAAALMQRHGVSHLVVVSADTLRPIGVLSTLDVAGVLAWGEA